MKNSGQKIIKIGWLVDFFVFDKCGISWFWNGRLIYVSINNHKKKRFDRYLYFTNTYDKSIINLTFNGLVSIRLQNWTSALSFQNKTTFLQEGGLCFFSTKMGLKGIIHSKAKNLFITLLFFSFYDIINCMIGCYQILSSIFNMYIVF